MEYHPNRVRSAPLCRGFLKIQFVMSASFETPSLLTDELRDACEAAIQYNFQDRAMLECALTHASVASTRLRSNERLEFLGDALLGAFVCEQLYTRYSESPEGELTRIKSVVVSRAGCGRISKRLGLEKFLFVGKGVAVQQHVPNSILAALFEALVGAIYLDGGYAVAREFVLREVDDEIERAAESLTGVNYKSLLQQFAQKDLGHVPTYVVLDEQGPDHSKCFHVAAVIGQRTFEPAWGASKKVAEQGAAQNAMGELTGMPVRADASDPPAGDGPDSLE